MKGRSGSKLSIVNKDNQKKKDLLDKMKNKSKANKATDQPIQNDKNNDEDNEFKKLYKNAKNKLEKAQRKIEELKNSPTNNSNDTKTNKEAKAELHQKEQEIKKLKKEHEEYLSEAESKRKAIEGENQKLREDLKVSGKINADLSRSMDLQKKKEQALARELKSFRDKVEPVKERIKELEYIQEANEKKIEKLEQALITSNKKIKLLEEISPSVLLDLLLDKMSVGNLTEFNLLPDIYNSYRKKSFVKSAMKKNSQHNISENEVTLFGHVREYNQDYIFVDVNEKVYSIEIMPQYQGKIINAAAQAIIIKDNKVQVTYFYQPEDEKMLKIDQEQSKAKRPNVENNNEYHYIGDFKVLVVTEKDKDKYVSRLEKHGLKVQAVEGRGKYKRIQTLIDSADIVIYLVEDISHVVSEQSKKDENPVKHQFVMSGNPEKVVQRVIYAKYQLGL
ncbi:hypothetical protein MKY91_20505 [Alkalicoccobacillus gibsonii]|uniref:DUF2325 domain-containing protein n=1 Tax=Alkalicoccobacillus gibsonii TaxID=79881 RepID=A0ABU9VNQ6_9BACI